MSKKYKIFCETDNRWEYYDSLYPIEVCPIDLEHTVREGSLSIEGKSTTEYNILKNDFENYIISLGSDIETGFDNAPDDIKILAAKNGIGSRTQRVDLLGEKEVLEKEKELLDKNVDGRALSNTITFASMNTSNLPQYHINTNSTSYIRIATFIYGGYNNVGSIIGININAWMSRNVKNYSIRIYDQKNAKTITEIKNISNKDEDFVMSMGEVMNLPEDSTLFELQMKKNGGFWEDRVYCGSIELKY
jgi:hypothetical protein